MPIFRVIPLSGTERPMDLKNRIDWFLQMHLLVLLMLVSIVIVILSGQEKYFQIIPIAIVTFLSVFFDLTCFSLLRRQTTPPRLIIHLHLVLDVVVITTLVHFTGGIISLFNLSYFLVIVASSILISQAAGMAVAMYSFAAFAAVVLMEYYGAVGQYPLFDIQEKLPFDYIYVYLTVYMCGLLFYAIAMISGRVQCLLARTQGTMLHMEKMSSVGKLAAGIAHEVNNPIGNVISYLDASEEAGKPLDTEGIGKIRNELRRAADTLSKMLSFSHKQPQTAQPTDINEVITEASAMLEPLCRRGDIQLQLQLAASLPAVTLVSNDLHAIIINLACNAIDSMATAGGRLTIRTARTESGRVRLTVSDTGTGISEDDLPHIFEPFFTSKPVGTGTGLGLFIVYGLVETHGGKITVESDTGTGSTFIISFPASRT